MKELMSRPNSSIALYGEQEIPFYSLASDIEQSTSQSQLTCLSNSQTLIKRTDFLVELQKKVTVPLEPLRQLLDIMATEKREIIKQALFKKNSYLRRFFSNESWEEWTENRTAVGKVVRVLFNFLDSDEMSIHKYLERLDIDTIRAANKEARQLLCQLDDHYHQGGFGIDKATVLAANCEAELLLDNIRQSNIGNEPEVDTLALLPSSQEIISTSIQFLVQNLVAHGAGLSPRHVLIMNLLSLSQSSYGALIRTKHTHVVEVGDSVNIVLERAEKLVEHSAKVLKKEADNLLVELEEAGVVLIDQASMRIIESSDHVYIGMKTLIKETLPIMVDGLEQAGAGLIEGISRGVKEIFFGKSQAHKLITEIKPWLRECQSFEKLDEILNYIKIQSQEALSPDDKVQAYQFVINSFNSLRFNEYDRDTINVRVVQVAMSDPHLQLPPGYFAKCLEMIGLWRNSIQAIVSTIPNESIRALLALNNSALINERLQLGLAHASSETLDLPAIDSEGRENSILHNTLLTIPAGTVLMSASPIVPEGYLACNGGKYEKSDYPLLYQAIGDRYTKQTQLEGEYFTIPDYRGRFPRCWDNSAKVDPDAASRLYANGSLGGDEVGTVQNDELKSHNHDFFEAMVRSNEVWPLAGTDRPYIWAKTRPGRTEATGGKETRPTNVNMMFFIKAGQSVDEKNLAHILKQMQFETKSLEQMLHIIKKNAEGESLTTTIITVAGLTLIINTLALWQCRNRPTSGSNRARFFTTPAREPEQPATDTERTIRHRKNK